MALKSMHLSGNQHLFSERIHFNGEAVHPTPLTESAVLALLRVQNQKVSAYISDREGAPFISEKHSLSRRKRFHSTLFPHKDVTFKLKWMEFVFMNRALAD